MSQRVILVGAGGHARVLADILKLNQVSTLGVTDIDSNNIGETFCGFPIIGGDAVITTYSCQEILLVNGIGSIGKTNIRRKLYEQYRQLGYPFAKVLHPRAIIAHDAILGGGVQVMAGGIIQPGAHIMENTIINTGAIIEHDCLIGKHVHVAPGAVLSGGVEVEENVHIGTGATIIQGIHIGANSLIAAGSVVVCNVPANKIVKGVPGRWQDA
jgi:sugar O-acyltransferase (sialic acid O-acetyltransferase NeuD family)